MPITNVGGSSPSAPPGNARQQAASNVAQGQALLNKAASIAKGNELGASANAVPASSGTEQSQAAAAASRSGDSMIEASKKIEDIKQKVTTAQGIHQLFTEWVRGLWKY